MKIMGTTRKKAKLQMASPFTAPPAGTEVPPSSDARYFYRRQAFSRNPVTGGNWQPGKSVNFVAEASGGHYLVPSECRIVARLLVGGGANVSTSMFHDGVEMTSEGGR